MHRETDHRPKPRDPVRAAGRGRMGMVVTVTGLVLMPARRARLDRHRLVLMEGEEPLEQEHHEEAEQERDHDRIKPAVQVGAAGQFRRRRFAPQDDRVRKHVDDAHAEHDARDERQGQLHAAVAELDERRQHAPEDRDREDDDAVDEKEHWFSSPAATPPRGSGGRPDGDPARRHPPAPDAAFAPPRPCRDARGRIVPRHPAFTGRSERRFGRRRSRSGCRSALHPARDPRLGRMAAERDVDILPVLPLGR